MRWRGPLCASCAGAPSGPGLRSRGRPPPPPPDTPPPPPRPTRPHGFRPDEPRVAGGPARLTGFTGSAGGDIC